ncbi:MAG: peptide deformylase [Patescibacteria group bacterium]|nr:peptide deformylase [Patescibacteria group bacterium]
MRILTINDKEEGIFLRKKTKLFDFREYSRKEISGLINDMRKIMKNADGIGLSANQIGFDFRMFVAEVEGKFYAIFNPELSRFSKETKTLEEGCLSVPDKFSAVTRPDKVLLTGCDRNGRKIKIKAWGLLARVFQHEVDHLDGKLFLDRIKKR